MTTVRKLTAAHSPYYGKELVASAPLKTTECLVDIFKHHLAKVICETPENLEDRKYYFRAFHMQWIGAAKPAPYFIVNLSDLTFELVQELRNLDNETRDFVLKQAIGRIFEDINFELYHNSISRNLRTKLEK